MIFSFSYAWVKRTRRFSMIALADDSPPIAAVRSMTKRISGSFSRMYSNEMLWPWVDETILVSAGANPSSSWMRPKREPGP